MQVNKIAFSCTFHYYSTSLLWFFQKYDDRDSWWVVLKTYLKTLNEDKIKNGYKIKDVQLRLTGGIEKSKGQTPIKITKI